MRIRRTGTRPGPLRGAIMTSNIHDLFTSAIAIGSGSLVSPEAHKSMIAPLTAQFPPFNGDLYYGLGILVTNCSRDRWWKDWFRSKCLPPSDRLKR